MASTFRPDRRGVIDQTHPQNAGRTSRQSDRHRCDGESRRAPYDSERNSRAALNKGSCTCRARARPQADPEHDTSTNRSAQLPLDALAGRECRLALADRLLVGPECRRRRSPSPRACERDSSTRRPDGTHACPEWQAAVPRRSPRRPTAPLHAACPAGTTSDTRPISCARLADRRSWLPSKERRMISWNGIFCSMCIGSNAAVMP